MAWSAHPHIQVYTPKGATQVNTCSLASFDLDMTLIMSSKGEATASGTSYERDWVWAYDNIPAVLRAIRDGGWTIVIFSNRRGSPAMLQAAKARVKAMFAQLGFECWVFFATGGKDSDPARKPQTGMLQLFVQLAGVKSWGAGSFYCGDAAGASSSDPWHRWSDVDRRFATAAGLTFYEPQERFSGFPVPDIPSHVRVIVTMGATGSGWEQWAPHENATLQLPDGRQLLVLKNAFMISKPDLVFKPNLVTLVYGAHPSEAQRQAVSATILGHETLSHTLYYWYARPPVSGKDAAYIAAFTFPPLEITRRIN